MKRIIFVLFVSYCLGSICFARQEIDNTNKDNRNYHRLKILSQTKFSYTEQARKNKVEGTVRLRITFNADKTIGNNEVIKELSDELTEQAIKAAKKTQFEPAMQNGVPIFKS